MMHGNMNIKKTLTQVVLFLDQAVLAFFFYGGHPVVRSYDNYTNYNRQQN